MCQLLNVSRSNYYTYKDPITSIDYATERIKRIFRDSNGSYGTRRIKVQCKREGVTLSRRRIARIMRAESLVSVYTKMNYKPQKTKVNRDIKENLLQQEFNHHAPLSSIVSDLTYVRVGNTWHYICTLLDLFNREIIGYSCGPRKTAELVLEAFESVKNNLGRINVFHTDRGNEFKNKLIEQLLDNFEIERSLSKAGNPYDNAVAEATFKSIKKEFVYQNTFNSLVDLKANFGAYVWWFNHQRLHSTLNYVSPVEYRINHSL